MQITAQIKPSEGKLGDLITLKVQFVNVKEKIKAVYATDEQRSWQLHKERENEYSLSIQIPSFTSPRTFNICIFAENEKEEKVAQVSIPFVVKDREVEGEPEFSRVNQVIQKLESAKSKAFLQKEPHFLEKIENYILSLKVAKRQSRPLRSSEKIVKQKPVLFEKLS